MTTSLKSLEDLKNEVSETTSEYSPNDTLINLLTMASRHFKEFETILSQEKINSKDCDSAYTSFMCCLTLISNIIPLNPNFKSEIQNGNNKNMKVYYNTLKEKILKDLRVDQIKELIKKRPIKKKESKESNNLLERFERLRVHNNLSPPMNLNYSSRSPSPSRNADEDKLQIRSIDENFLNKFIIDDKSGALKWYMNPSDVYTMIREIGNSILFLDIRYRKEFDKSHINEPNVVCIEPFSINNNFGEKELEESLLISPENEQKLFLNRDLFELVILYDNDYFVPKNENESLQNMPQYFKKLLVTLNDKSYFKPLKRRPIILNGGFSTWSKLYGRDYVTKPRIEKLVEPDSIPSRPLSFRKTSISSSSSSLPLNIGINDDYKSNKSNNFGDKHFQSNNNNNSYNNINTLESIPYAKNLQDFMETSNNNSIFPQQQSILEHKRLSISSVPSLPLKSPITSPNSIKSYNNGIDISPPAAVAFSPVSPQLENNDSIVNNNNNVNNIITTTKPISFEFTSGLYNLGNSCYMNCVIQCLTGTSQLSFIFLNNSFKRYINVNSKLGSKGVLATNYYEVVKLMSKTDGSYIIPSKFKRIVGSLHSEFKGNDQQDCQEFLNFLLDGLHEDLNQAGGKPPLKPLTEEEENKRELLPLRLASTIEWERYLKTDFSTIVDIFQGQYLSRLECLTCGKTSTTYQAFSTLSVPIPESNRPISVNECFKEFTKVEILDGEDRWKCPRCKVLRKSTKCLKITRLPKILIIHFKRFKQGFGLEKLNTLITYPIDSLIDLTNYWTPIASKDEELKLLKFNSRGQVPPFKYKVYAIINHIGNYRGGHYTSFVYKGNDKKWCYFDDTKCYKNQDINKIISKDNYVIFLSRV